MANPDTAARCARSPRPKHIGVELLSERKGGAMSAGSIASQLARRTIRHDRHKDQVMLDK
jgi:hypothetical protein